MPFWPRSARWMIARRRRTASPYRDWALRSEACASCFAALGARSARRGPDWPPEDAPPEPGLQPPVLQAFPRWPPSVPQGGWRRRPASNGQRDGPSARAQPWSGRSRPASLPPLPFPAWWSQRGPSRHWGRDFGGHRRFAGNGRGDRIGFNRGGLLGTGQEFGGLHLGARDGRDARTARPAALRRRRQLRRPARWYHPDAPSRCGPGLARPPSAILCFGWRRHAPLRLGRRSFGFVTRHQRLGSGSGRHLAFELV